MTRQTGKEKATRRHHSPEYRTEALALAKKVGIPEAARQLGVHKSQLYGWRAKARAKQGQSDVEQRQAAEIVRLKRKLAEQEEELAIVKQAATYFARSLQ